MSNTIAIKILADTKGINNGIKDVNSKLGGFEKTLGKVGSALKTAFAVGAAAAIGGGLVTGVKSAITAASDLNETMSKTQTIFGKATPTIVAFGNSASKSMGISKQEALAGASAFGNFFDQIGLSKKASADMSKGLVQMSSDLASFNNADPAKVMEALQGATRGEYDSLQQFIPTVNAAKVQTEALALSHKKSAAALTDADKATALYSLAQKGMGKAQGDFARTSGGLANQQRILSARFKDLQANLGTKLLPIATKVVTFFATGFGPAMDTLKGKLAPVGAVLTTMGGILKNQVVPAIGAFVGFVRDNATVFIAAAAAIGAVTLAIGIYKGVMTTVSAVTKAYTAVQAALNVVMALNPVALVVLALVALAAIFVVLWKRSTTFRTIVTGAFEAVKTAVGAVVNFFKNLPGNISKAVGNLGSLLKNKAIDLITGFIKGYIGAYVAVGKFFIGLAGSVLKFIGNVAGSLAGKGKDFITGFIKGYVNAFIAVGTFFGGVAGKVVKALGNVSSTLYSAGQDLLRGMISGLKSMAGNLASAALAPVKDAVKGVKNFLGINSPSKLFKGFGINVNQGLILGLQKTAGVSKAAGNVALAVQDGFTRPTLSLAVDDSGNTGFGGGLTVNFNGGNFVGTKSEFGKLVTEAYNENVRFGGPKLVTL